MKDAAEELMAAVDADYARLDAMRDESTAIAPAPGKWSPREIIGHLVDSAINNHVRIVRAQLEDDMVFPGYDQERWVSMQRYRDRSWSELISLWRALNSHIAMTVELIPLDVATRPRTRHNLDRIGWKTVPRDRPATLEYLVRDYIGHLRHHLAQIP